MKVGDLNFAFSVSGASSVEDATDDVAKSMDGVESATKEAASAQGKVQNELKETEKAAEQAADAQRDFSGNTGLASNTLTSITDGLADARFGLAGAANNASFAAESFAELASQTGGAGTALKALGSSLAGPLGIVVAFQSLIALAPAVIDFFSDAEQGAKNAKDEIQSTADAVGSFADQVQSAGQTEQVVERLESIQDALGRGIFADATEELERFGITTKKEAARVRRALDSLIGRLQTDPQQEEFFTALTDLKVPPQVAQELSKIAVAADQAGEETKDIEPPEPPDIGQVDPEGEVISFDADFGGLFEDANVQQIEEALGQNLIQSVGGADDALQSLQTAFKQATSQEQRNRIQALINRVKLLRQEFKQTGTQTSKVQKLGQQAAQTLRQGFLQVGNSVGNVVGGLLSGERGFQAFAQAGKQAIQQLISQLASLAIKLAVIQPLLGALGIGTGGAGLALPGATGAVGGGLGGFLNMTGGGAAATIQGGKAQLAQGSLKIPVEVIDQAQGRGAQNRTRVGRA